MILDPPKLAQDRKQKSKALRTYADMNTLAMRSTGSEGLMLTCSCTGCVSESEFLGVLQQAAVAAKRKVRVLEIRGAAPDHPIALEFPEGRYLKAVLLQLQ